MLLSNLGIHLFKDTELILVGELQTPLGTMLDHLRESSEIEGDGRVDLLTHEGDPKAGALLRRSSTKTWPRPMLPADYRLAA